MNHTPGPWAISRLATPDYAPEFGIYAEGSQRDLARVFGDNSAADAALIRAAPMLLAALQEFFPMVGADWNCQTEEGTAWAEKAREAIAEATGDLT